ncbi:MAG: hypothetical protein NVS1B13_13350 [Flavisolibacter sp.]
MKKILICFSFLGFSMWALAQQGRGQTFKPFKGDIALVYALPAGSPSKGGIIFALEPKYAINDLISFGLRIETAIMAKSYLHANGSYLDDFSTSGSYLVTADYYILTEDFRPL